MLKLHRIATTSFRTWSPDITEPESRPASTTNLTPEHSLHGVDSWVDIDEVPARAPVSTPSSPTSAYSDDSKYISRSDLERNTPTIDPDLSGTTMATDAHVQDTVTFPPNAVHLLPSERNGTWRTQACYAVRSSSEAASTFREVLKQHAHELDLPTLLHKLEQVAEDRKDNISDWLNQTFSDYDLVEMHDRVRQLVPVISMPNMRQIGHAIDAVADIAESLRQRPSEADLLDSVPCDQYTFAQTVGQKARRALIDQGFCKEWQFLNEKHAQLQHSMQSALIHTFVRMQQLHQHVSLSKATPQWVVNRTEKVWRLELDVGVIGVEVGPESDRSLLELGFINAGFELPESYGCVPIADIERQAQNVEDDWQLLKM